jgi:hypothetical protein
MTRYQSATLVVVTIILLGSAVALYQMFQKKAHRLSLAPGPALASPRSLTASLNSIPGPNAHLGAPATTSTSPAAVLIHVQQCSELPAMLEAHHRGDCGPAVPSDPKGLASYAECLNKAGGEQETIGKLQDQLKTCSADDLTPAGLFAATTAAAEQGDEYARICFIQGRFRDWSRRDQPPLPQSDVDAYLALAPQLIEQGLAWGDWRVVAMLARGRFLLAPGDLLTRTHYGVGTPQTAYKMTRLLQLGANQPLAANLQQSLNQIAHPDGDADPALTAEEVAAADQWAQAMYAAHFANSPGFDEMPPGCVRRWQ